MIDLDTTNLTTCTPQQIDETLYEIYVEIAVTKGRSAQAWGRIYSIAHSVLGLDWRTKVTDAQVRDVCAETEEMAEAGEVLVYPRSTLWETMQQAQGLSEKVDDLIMSQQPYDEEYERRGRWTRAFLVTNTGGHVHKTMHCSTCFPTTSYHWVTDLSDHDEAEIVAAAGERACTVCYPTAPVGVKGTSIFSPDEQEAQRKREEREEKRAAKEASKVVVDGMQGWTNDRGDRHVYPTPRGATNAIAGLLGSLCWYGTTHPSAPEWEHNVKAIREALEAKGVEYDYDKALANARKKVIRDGSQPKY